MAEFVVRIRVSLGMWDFFFGELMIMEVDRIRRIGGTFLWF